MENMNECRICFHAYNHERNKPLVLPCSHSFCQVCLEKLAASRQQICPFCQQSFQGTPVKDLLFCYQLISSSSSTATSSRPHRKCEEHHLDNIAWCEPCSVLLCVKCLQVEHKQCGWVPVEEKLKTTREAYTRSVAVVADAVSRGQRKLRFMDRKLDELLRTRDTVMGHLKQAEAMLLNCPKLDEYESNISIADLESKISLLTALPIKPLTESPDADSVVYHRYGNEAISEARGKKCFGIHLGMTYSCVGTHTAGRVEIICNEMGNRRTPNYVGFTNEKVLVGESARVQVGVNVGNTVFDILKLIGRKFNDQRLQDSVQNWPFKVVDCNRYPQIQVQYKGEQKLFATVQITSFLLDRMRQDVETYMQDKVTHAVLTVPTFFDASQRQSTREAAELSGLSVLELVDEPIAAAIAYGVDKRGTGRRNVVVFDLSSSLEVSVISFDEGEFEVIATKSDGHISGEEVCKRLVKHMHAEILRIHNKDLFQNERAVGKVRQACKRAIKELSNGFRTRIEIYNLFDGMDFTTSVIRSRFEKLCSGLFDRALVVVQEALLESNLSEEDIHEVILIGGSSRIPKVRELLQEFFKEAILNVTINPDEVVAYGASVRAARLVGEDVV